MLGDISFLPLTAEVNQAGHLMVGGCDTVEIAREYGTPLYIFDEFTIRRKCREYRAAFSECYPDSQVIYAAKAFLHGALACILMEEGLGIDVVSAGELGMARKNQFPASRVYCHGNNKSAEEITGALEYGVGRIVVDNLYELAMLNEIASGKNQKVEILLRLSPGVDAHTHQYITTGVIDSKFGITISDAEEAVAKAMAASHLNLVGFHSHIGSQISEVEPYQLAMELVLKFAAEMKIKHRFELRELNVGGGFAIQYTQNMPAPAIDYFAGGIAGKLSGLCQELGLDLPHLTVEPGRAIVGQSGIALYRAGAIKNIPGVRCYVSVDGGMGDNIRTALYQAEYEAVVASNMQGKEKTTVTIAGKFCESGDILVRDISLPRIVAGDIIAIAAVGAYCLPMASNYNASFRPAIIMVTDGKARLIRRRETLDDLTNCDV